MSISIGRIPAYETRDIPLIIYTGSSNLISLQSDLSSTNIYFNDGFRIGQQNNNNGTTFQIHQGTKQLVQFSSNQLIYLSNVILIKNGKINQNLIGLSNFYSGGVYTSNASLYGKQEVPFKIRNPWDQLLFEITKDGIGYLRGNLGIGNSPTYALDIHQSVSIHSNLIVKNTTQGMTFTTSNLRGLSNLNELIDFHENYLLLNAPEVILNNPTLTGSIQITGVISLEETVINNLSSSNIRILNNRLNQQALYIKNLNPSGFANTAYGGPLQVDSYLGETSGRVPIFGVDTFGRITVGQLNTKDTLPEYGFSYHITSNLEPYLSDFIQWITPYSPDKTIISKDGFIGIGGRPTQHPLQIQNTYTTYETNYEPISSLIGVRQTTSNASPILLCYDSNQSICFHLTSNGTMLFHPHQLYGDDYSLEINERGYIRTLHTDHIFTEQPYIDGYGQTLSNLQQLNVNYLDIHGCCLSNMTIYGLTTPTINIEAFEYIDKPATNYKEFRIATDRLLFYGSNLVMNWNHNFFEIEQVPLTDDNLRIYANGGPNDSVNVIHTIANNAISTLRMNNCNIAENTATRLRVEANGKRFSLGTVYKSLGTEAFITNNADITNPNRQLSIKSTGIRIGNSAHLTQTAKVTFGDTTEGVYPLNIKGDVLIQTPSSTNALSISTIGNIGIGTDDAQRPLVLQVPVVSITGNLGIGTATPTCNMDVNGTLRASRILGVQFTDVLNAEANTTQWDRFGCNIYYNKGGGNVGIGTSTINIARLHIDLPLTKDLALQFTSNYQGTNRIGFDYRKNQTLIYGQHANWQHQSKASFYGSLSIGYPSLSNDMLTATNSILVDGQIGIGTTYPTASLHVQRDVRVTGNFSNEDFLVVGTPNYANVGGTLYLGGTYGDDSYDHTVIENRVYSGTKSELLFFKGNDSTTTSGPDHIRLRAQQIDFDVYASNTTDRYQRDIVARLKPTQFEVYGKSQFNTATYTTSLKNLDGTRILQYNEYRDAGNYTISQPANYSYVRIQMWGAGGGGGGANIQETANLGTGTQLGGGGGGGGGAYGDVIIPYDIAGYSTLSATIGTGGAGGLAGYIDSSEMITTTKTSSGTNGQAATAGTSGTSTSLTLTTTRASSLTATWTVGGGDGGGTTNTTTGGSAGTGGTIGVSTYFNSIKPGTAGGAGGSSGAGIDGTSLTGGSSKVASTIHPGTANTGLGASGGGGGAGTPASAPTTYTYYSGGNSGAGCIPYTYLTGIAIFAYGDKYTTTTLIQTAQNGYSYSETYGGGTGGGGGFSLSANVAAGYYGYGNTGKLGGWPGGGGGGGGAARAIHPSYTSTATGYSGGNGGPGADGGMLVTFY